MDISLKGKKVLILGASRGIGLGIAEAFVQKGAQVMICARQKEDLERAIVHLKDFSSAQVCSYQGDMLKLDHIQVLQEAVSEKFGSLDHLICNIGSGRSVAPGQEDRAEAQRMMDINFMHVVETIRFFRPLLCKNDQISKELSTITLIGSICGRRVLGCPSAYAAAKAALVHYAKNLVKPLALEGIRINVVSPGNIFFPGSVWEEKLKNSEDVVKAMLENEVPLKRFGTPQDIAAAVVYLASSQAGYITGTELVVDGGQSI